MIIGTFCLITGIVIGLLIRPRIEAQRAFIRNLKRYGSDPMPQIIYSMFPGDDTVLERAERVREYIRESGNPYQPPVYVCIMGENGTEEYQIEYLRRLGRFAGEIYESYVKRLEREFEGVREGLVLKQR